MVPCRTPDSSGKGLGEALINAHKSLVIAKEGLEEFDKRTFDPCSPVLLPANSTITAGTNWKSNHRGP